MGPRGDFERRTATEGGILFLLIDSLSESNGLDGVGMARRYAYFAGISINNILMIHMMFIVQHGAIHNGHRSTSYPRYSFRGYA